MKNFNPYYVYIYIEDIIRDDYMDDDRHMMVQEYGIDGVLTNLDQFAYRPLYVGRTNNLPKRIKSHDSNPNDNIDRAFESVLNMSQVYYLEVPTKEKGMLIESYLIDLLKPRLNKALKDDVESDWNLNISGWKLFGRKKNVELRLNKYKKYREEHPLITSVTDFIDYEKFKSNERLVKHAEWSIKKNLENKQKFINVLKKEYENCYQ